MDERKKHLLISVISYIVIYGLIIALWCLAGPISYAVIIICAIFGWQALNRIQPSMFIWLPWVGWLIYFLIKFTLSAFVGIFVTPYRIAKLIVGTTDAES